MLITVRNELPVALSLFSGAGGLDVGVDAAGFRTLCSIELDKHCVMTLLRNSKKKTVWQVNVKALDPTRALASLTHVKGELALLHGGPPCQPFSQIGKRRGFSDPRGQLAFELVRFAKALRPACVLIEQVPKFLDSPVAHEMRMLDVLHEAFHQIHYELYVSVLNAADFGMPQLRKRAFLVAVQAGQSFEFPSTTSRTFKNVGSAIEDLPSAVKANEVPLAPNHVDVTPPRDRYRISFVREGEWLAKSKNAPKDAIQKLTAKDSTKFRRLHRNLPSLTIRGGETFYHPVENRYLTPREAARIQGFSDSYVFAGPIRRRTGSVKDLDQHRQIANAVPPPLAKLVASAIKSQLSL